jgi:hypothetical protein
MIGKVWFVSVKALLGRGMAMSIPADIVGKGVIREISRGQPRSPSATHAGAD